MASVLLGTGSYCCTIHQLALTLTSPTTPFGPSGLWWTSGVSSQPPKCPSVVAKRCESLGCVCVNSMQALLRLFLGSGYGIGTASLFKSKPSPSETWVWKSPSPNLQYNGRATSPELCLLLGFPHLDTSWHQIPYSIQNICCFLFTGKPRGLGAQRSSALNP